MVLPSIPLHSSYSLFQNVPWAWKEVSWMTCLGWSVQQSLVLSLLISPSLNINHYSPKRETDFLCPCAPPPPQESGILWECFGPFPNVKYMLRKSQKEENSISYLLNWHVNFWDELECRTCTGSGVWSPTDWKDFKESHLSEYGLEMIACSPLRIKERTPLKKSQNRSSPRPWYFCVC